MQFDTLYIVYTVHTQLMIDFTEKYTTSFHNLGFKVHCVIYNYESFVQKWNMILLIRFLLA